MKKSILNDTEKNIKRLTNSLNIPKWYILVVVAVSTALILYGVVYPSIQYTKGIFLDSALYGSPNVLERIQPVRSYTESWNELDIISAFVCLFMGFVCFILGIARSANKLGGEQIYMLSFFSGLFAVNTLSLTEIAGFYVTPIILFYTYWLTYFTYPIALFLHLYSYFSEEVKIWIWALPCIPVIYSLSVFIVHLTFGFPYEIFGKLYTPVTAVCLLTLLITGLFKLKQRPISLFIRILSGLWFTWSFYICVRILKFDEYIHNEYKNGITMTAVFIVCFIIFSNSRELFSYKYDLQIMSLQNRLVRENYEQIKTHLQQIGSIKHEVRNHLSAMQLLLKNERYTEAINYLDRYTEKVNTVNESIYHDNLLLNSIVSTLIYKSRELGVRVELDLKASPANIADLDLYSLFTNIITNALDSCELIPEETDRFIKLAISEKEPYFNMMCINSVAGERIQIDGKFQTTKEGKGHGYGLKVVERIVYDYDGIFDIDYHENVFRVMVSLKNRKIMEHHE